MGDAENRVALIEIIERDGRVRQQLDVRRWPLTIGRALDRDLVIEDPHVAAAHAVLTTDDDGALWLEVGDSHNGVRVGRRTLRAGERVALAADGEPLHFGLTRLRVRRAGDPVPAERPLVGLSSPRTLAWTVALTAALWLVLLAQHWIQTDPNSNLTQWLPVLMGPPGALALWCAAWALASKLFQHRFEFGAHWALAVRWLLGLSVTGIVLTVGAAALGAPLLFAAVGLVELAIVALGLFGHARLVLPTHARGLAWSFGAAFVVGIGVMMVMSQQREERLFGPLYMHVLPHPVLRLARPQTPEVFVERTKAWHDKLDTRARADADEEEPLAADAGS